MVVSAWAVVQWRRKGTVCPQAANCPAGMKYAMINRGGAKDSPNSCQI
eukprot:COSAG02_NODE_10250_length_1986_cov_2.899841_1_plen_47_part_10